jgi:hypothetical protein
VDSVLSRPGSAEYLEQVEIVSISTRPSNGAEWGINAAAHHLKRSIAKTKENRMFRMKNKKAAVLWYHTGFDENTLPKIKEMVIFA